MKYYNRPIRLTIIEKSDSMKAGKDMNKLKSLYKAHESVNCYTQFGKRLAVSWQVIHILTILSSISTPLCLLRRSVHNYLWTLTAALFLITQIWKSVFVDLISWEIDQQNVVWLIAYGEQCRICDLWSRFSSRTRDQAWSLKNFCVAEFY